MQTITDLLTPQTQAQVRAAMVNILVTLGIRADLWRSAGTASTILTVVAGQFANFQNLIVQAIGSFFLPTASGAWLTLLAYYVYGITRPGATFATGSETLVNSGGGNYVYSPGQVTFLNSTTGQTYTNVTAISLGPLSTQTIQLQATTAGSIGNAVPGEIDALVTVMSGVTVSNAAAVVGSDAMSDPDLRTLCTNSIGITSVRGPRNVYAYAASVAVNPVSGAPVNINRTAVSASSHTGTVLVVCAAPSGAPTSDDLTGVENAIEDGVPGQNPPFSGARPDGVTVTVVGASPVAYTAPLTVWAQALPGLVASDVQTAVENALLSFFQTYPINGLATDSAQGVFAAAIEGVCRAPIVLGGSTVYPVFDVDGAVDLALGSGQVATDDTTVSVRLVA